MKPLPPGDSETRAAVYRQGRQPGALDGVRHLEATPENPGPGPVSSGLLDYWRILQRRRGTVVLIASLGLIAGVLFTLPETPIYQARAVIEIQPLNENFLNMGNVNPTASGSSAWYPEYDLQTQAQVLQSGALLDRVVKKLETHKTPIVAARSRLGEWRKALGLAPPTTGVSPVNAAMAGFRVRPRPNTRLIEILSDSPSPQFAADFANTLASEYIELNLESRWKASEHTGEWLTRQLDQMKIKLEKSEEALQAYARQAGLLFTQEKDNVAEQKLHQLQDELSRAQADRVARQSRYELASRSSAETLAEVLDDASLKGLKEKLMDLRRQEAELDSSLTAEHPKVKKVRAQIGTLAAALERERGNIVRRIQNDFESAARREKLLAADFAAHAALMAGQADKVTHYNILRREVETNRQLYDSMLQRVKEAGLASALRASNVRVVDPAAVPRGPYKPSLVRNAALGLFAGCFLGLIIVVFRERADRTVQDPGDTPLYLGVPELGIVPSASADPLQKRSLLPARLSQPSRTELELVTWQIRASVMAESFRTTLASLLFNENPGVRPRVVVLSSAGPKEGKTTVIANLAITLADIRQRVLLIDADLRKPRLHCIFKLDNSHGLVDLLRAAAPIVLNGEVKTTGIPNLSVLTAGASQESDLSLLYSPRLPELIASARAQYDMVLIDTPPMLTMSDARVVASTADGVVLVARANQTSRDSILAAAQRFSEDGTRIIGTVLNDWNPRRSNRYGYGGYYEKYKHYYAPKR